MNSIKSVRKFFEMIETAKRLINKGNELNSMELVVKEFAKHYELKEDISREFLYQALKTM